MLSDSDLIKWYVVVNSYLKDNVEQKLSPIPAYQTWEECDLEKVFILCGMMVKK